MQGNILKTCAIKISKSNLLSSMQLFPMLSAKLDGCHLTVQYIQRNTWPLLHIITFVSCIKQQIKINRL